MRNQRGTRLVYRKMKTFTGALLAGYAAPVRTPLPLDQERFFQPEQIAAQIRHRAMAVIAQPTGLRRGSPAMIVSRE